MRISACTTRSGPTSLWTTLRLTRCSTPALRTPAWRNSLQCAEGAHRQPSASITGRLAPRQGVSRKICLTGDKFFRTLPLTRGIRGGPLSAPGARGGLLAPSRRGPPACHCTTPDRRPAFRASEALRAGVPPAPDPTPRQERQDGFLSALGAGTGVGGPVPAPNLALSYTEVVQNVAKWKILVHADFLIRGLDMGAFLLVDTFHVF